MYTLFLSVTCFSYLTVAPGASSETIDIYATCKTLGRLEQCGCATDIEGGLEARAGFMEKARRENPNAILVDLGGFMPLKTEKKKPQFVLSNEIDVNAAVGQMNLQAMERLGYDAVLATPDDLAYGAGAIAKDAQQSRFLCTQIGAALDWIAPHRVVERNGVKIGFIGVASLSDKTQKISDGIEFVPASKTIPPAVEELRVKQNVDAVVLLVHEPPPGVKRWLAAYQGAKIDAVIMLDFGVSMEKLGGVILANACAKGRAVGKISLTIEKGQGITDAKFQRIPLYPSNNPNSAMRDFLTQSYAQIIEKVKLASPEPETGAENENGYVGAETCMGCHQEEYDQWKTTRHASAFFDLLEQTRHWVPECVQCHTTGYQKPGGFQQFPQTSGLMQVQCESCHGPGQKHMDEFGLGEIQRVPDRSLCIQCHTKKFSPKFESMFDLYIKQVKHK